MLRELTQWMHAAWRKRHESYSPLTGSGSVSFEVRVAGAERGAVLLLLVVFWLAQPQLHIRSGLGAETEIPGGTLGKWGKR